MTRSRPWRWGERVLEWLCLPHLALASISDYRTLRVPNATWMHLWLIGIVRIAIDPSVTFGLLTPSTLSMILSLTIGIALWMAGFGGADAKAVMVLGLFLDPFQLTIGLFCAIAGSLGMRLGRRGNVPVIPYLTLGVLAALILPVAVQSFA